ncbi:MAG: DUF2367 domain-containing protein [bacterium]|nr:DUF2367 domain-containing protein [bacterium]
MYGPVCSTCGTALTPGGAFCGTCGTAQAPMPRQAAPPMPQPQPYGLAPSPYTQPVPQPMVVRAQFGGGDACPRCYTVGMASNTYTVWHFLIAIFWFPIGLLAFLAPVKRCVCGNDYGLGVALVRFMQVMLVITLVVALVIIAAIVAGAS